MAKLIGDEAKTGDLVYGFGYPQNPGIIRKIVSDETLESPNWEGNFYRKIMVEVEWLKETNTRKKRTITSTKHLQNFESLIEDHRRKYENQTKLAEQLRKM